MTAGTPWPARELGVGDVLPERVDGPVTVTDFVRYQGASGDMNPLHHDTDYALAAGFPAPFAVGMLQAGALGTHLADLFGPSAVVRLAVRFLEQVWPGDVLTYGGVVESRDGDLLHLALTVVRQTGGVHISGTAVVDCGDSTGGNGPTA
jgi:acyl dehydratase